MRHILAAVLVVLVAGCGETSIDPFDNDEKYFTVYGFLDQLETNHAVRVIPITRNAERILTPTEDNRIDARVFSIDQTTGQIREWTHEFEELEDGTYGHVFRARFLIQPGRRYRLEIVRADGKMSWAETQVPTVPDAALLERGPVDFNADSTEARQTIVIPRIPSPWNINSIHLLNNQNVGLPGGTGGALQAFFFVPYGRSGHRTADGGWQITLNLTQDTRTVRKTVADYRAQGAYDDTPESVLAMGVQVRILDAGWDPPEGIFDPEILAQPGVLSNVEHGLGYFGSIGIYRQEWPVERPLAKALGYEW